MNFKKDVHDTLLYLQQKNVDIKELVRFLQKTPEIKELHLHGCNISDKDVKVLADANLSLSCLNLRDNKIGDEGAKALANGSLTKLTYLDLRNNKIGNEGAKALANGNFIGLISLYLESNKIGDEGIEALANGSLTKLFYLDLGLDKISNGVSVDSSNEAREHCTFFENQSKAVHPNTLALKLKDALDKLKSQQSNQDSVTDRHASLDTDSDDGSCFSWGTNWSGKEISGVASPAEAESQQLSSAQRELAAKTNELEDVKCQLREKERDLDVVNQRALQERDSAQRELAAKTNELEDVKCQLREKERDLGVVNQRTLQERDSAQRELAAKTNELEGVKYQLREKERDLGVVNQRALQERDSAQQELAAKTNELEGVKYQLREKERDLGVVNQRALQERGSAQRELAAKTKELNGKNKKFSEANTQSIRQGNYASTFFILSGVCAVGVSLTIPYLAICITFAVAASIFLAVGCYCSYKANTALSNVEVKNGVNPAVVEV